MEIEDFSPEVVNYIYGDVNEEEKVAFEEKLKTDPELVADVARLMKIIGEIKLGVQLEEIMNDPGYDWADKVSKKDVREHQKKNISDYLTAKRFRRNVIYPVAATVLVLVYVGNVAFFLMNPDLAFQKYVREYTPVYYAQATVNDAQELFRQSMNKYNTGDYHTVAENMRTLMEQGKLNTRGLFFLGIYDGWMEFSETIWDKKIDPDKTDQEDAAWYLALTSFKLNDLSTAQIFLQKISAENNRTGKKAARLERKISRILRTK